MPAFTPTPFARALLAHARRWRALQVHGDPRAPVSPMLPTWTEGIWPPLASRAAEVLVEDQVRPHSHLAALHSSMAFAFNLFLPFREGADPAPALAPLLGPLTVHQVRFEWIPPGDILGELQGDRPQPTEAATGVDVLLTARRPDGSRVLVLVEVKLSEGGFTPCQGRGSRGNRHPERCDQATTFLADPPACYLRRPARARRDRRYWDIFQAAHGSVAATFPGAPPGPCPFAQDAQQPMRLYALALGLEQAGLADETWLLLVHHDNNPDVPDHWSRWTSLLRPEARVARLPASALLPAGPADWAQWMTTRYRLPSP